MKKKLLVTVVLSLVMMFAFSSMAMASDVIIPQFSDDTMISEDNIHDVVEFLGMNPYDIIATKDGVQHEWITVGELKATIEQSKEKPEIEFGVQNLSRGYGTKEVYCRINLTPASTLFVRATGDYYSSSSIRYWTNIKSARFSFSEGIPGFNLRFKGSNSLDYSIVNPGASDSYLRCVYSATVVRTQPIGGFDVPVGEWNINDSYNFYASDWL